MDENPVAETATGITFYGHESHERARAALNVPAWEAAMWDILHQSTPKMPRGLMKARNKCEHEFVDVDDALDHIILHIFDMLREHTINTESF